ncbi:hypothetical protein CDL12_23842 [Handroanthus impetiginosus]|uniref:Uncharacterized protein n=1 Tax=Handroanthus impetiginosus TaxID=429701 RepID=A0A2G9GEB7_9LAMI|nr:hypothetical protein CDL12_23842 [Handroanthus impetiginosus]
MDWTAQIHVLLLIYTFLFHSIVYMRSVYIAYLLWYGRWQRRRVTYPRRYSMIAKMPNQFKHLHEMVELNDIAFGDDCTYEIWKHFKGCLGALDGIFIEVQVLGIEQNWYHSRKGLASVNVLGICSAADSMVLRDALNWLHGRGLPAGNVMLRSPSFYSVRVQNLIILACTLLRNFIHSSMSHDPLEDLDLDGDMRCDHNEVELVKNIKSSSVWSA